MAKNLTNIHGKLDRILGRLSKLDTQTMTDRRRSENQTRLMTQMLGVMSQSLNRIAEMQASTLDQITEMQANTLDRIAEMQANTLNVLQDVAFMANEARKEAKEAKERVIELSSGSRRH